MHAAKCPGCKRYRLVVSRGTKDKQWGTVATSMGHFIRQHQQGHEECAGSGAFIPEDELIEAFT